MLLYVESTVFPHRTFIVRVQPQDTVARVRAQLLHILYDLGHEDHQFRLRFKGQYLRDAYTIQDYAILENALLKMVPLSRDSEPLDELRSLTTSNSSDLSPIANPSIKDALDREVQHFKQRERLIFDFRGLLYIHFMSIFFALLTFYWYSFSWTAFCWLLGTTWCPSFSRITGFRGKQSTHKNAFCIVFGTVGLLSFGASVYLAVVELIRIVNDGCEGWVFDDGCSHQHVYSAVFYSVQAVCLLVSAVIVWVMFWNFKVEYGDYVERYLVQTRDIEQVMRAAKKGRTKEKRIAAFELATLAASDDDNKFLIVAEGGLDILMRMALLRDTATQEHAVEAIAELLTVPSIQDNFVEMGGVRTLTALLNSSESRLVYEAASALSYIAADSEDNIGAIAADHGLDDLCHGARHGPVVAQRLIAGVFLELAFQPDIRAAMVARNSIAQALIHLFRSNDPETQRYALQTLELLAIESSDMICAQEELLSLLLELPMQSMDERLYLLAGKIMLYFAEDRNMCEQLLDHHSVRDSLYYYARCKDPILQKVVVKVIFCCLETKELKNKARERGLKKILQYVKDHATDREAWDMADQALQVMMSDDDFATLPSLSTVEKLNCMEAEQRAEQLRNEFGSRVSLGSRNLAASIEDNNTIN